MPKQDEKNIRCSFCGKHQSQVKRIIAGPNAYICNECIELCVSILNDEMKQGKNPVDPGAGGTANPEGYQRLYGWLYRWTGSGKDCALCCGL